MTSLKEFLIAADLSDTTVCVHAALRSLTPRISAANLIEAFLAVNTTILVPTFTYFYECSPPVGDCPANNGCDYLRDFPVEEDSATAAEVFDPGQNKLSTRDMGHFPLQVLATPGRLRGSHPLNSFTALGSRAADLIAGQTAEDVYFPLRQLVRQQGHLLLLGTDLTSLTFIHYAEMLSGRNLFIRWARDQRGEVRRARIGSCSNGFNQLGDALQARTAEFHQANWQIAPASDAAQSLTAAISGTPTLTRCANVHCRRCIDALAGGPR